MFKLTFAVAAKTELDRLKYSASEQALYRQVQSALRKLSQNPHYPGLNSHRFHGLRNPIDSNAPVFTSYVQNNTPAAYRIFWCYGPARQQITIIAITPHP